MNNCNSGSRAENPECEKEGINGELVLRPKSEGNKKFEMNINVAEVQNLLCRLANDLPDNLRELLPANLYQLETPAIELKASTPLYRCIGADRLGENRPFDNTESYQICPKEKQDKIPLGRCNLPGQRVFYAAGSVACAEMENLRFSLQQLPRPMEFYVSEWSITEPTNVFPMLSTNSFETITASSINEIFSRDLLRKFSEHSRLLSMLEEYFTRFGAFNPKKSIYNLTAAISSAFLTQYEGIAYRSAQFENCITPQYGSKTDGKYHLNFAFRETLCDSDSRITLNCVYRTQQKFYIHVDGNKRVQRNWLEIGHPDENGIISFRYLSDEEKHQLWLSNPLVPFVAEAY